MGVQPQRILIVEDSATIAGMLRELFVRGGFDAVTVSDGRSALDEVRHGEPPGAAVVDLMLPYADGFSVVEAMREDPRWSGVPVVMLSARQLPPDVERARRLGVRRYLTKPFDVKELLATVRGLVATPV